MSEFRIHHDVNELLGLLNVSSGDGAELYIDLLQKNRTPYVTTTVSSHSAKVNTCTSTSASVQCSSLCTTPLDIVSQVKIVEHSKTPEDFLRKYEELKSKNARSLDPLVYLLSKLTEDKEVHYIHNTTQHNIYRIETS